MIMSVVGAGYVGLVAGACFASQGHSIVCTDVDADKIASLAHGIVPAYEPGLEDLIREGLRQGRLSYTTDSDEAVRASSVIFIAVGTPTAADGTPDTSAVFNVADIVRHTATAPKMLVVKSTAPVGTVQTVRAFVSEVAQVPVAVVSNPEFLREGHCVEDFLHPWRVVVGADGPEGAAICDLYRPFVSEERILLMDTRSAEMSKYASNAFLASKISFINEIANLCERMNADVELVRKAVGLDPRIGPGQLAPGIGYGGSCFPKDVQAVLHMGRTHGLDMEILAAAQHVNQTQTRHIWQKMMDYFGGSVAGKRIAVWGLAFKPGTDDMREAPSLVVIELLRRSGANVVAYDPHAMDAARAFLDCSVEFATNPYTCLVDADALVLLTEWQELRRPDWVRIHASMRTPVVFDGRNVFDPESATHHGFEYFGVGRGLPQRAAGVAA